MALLKSELQRADPRRVYACVERSKAEGIKQRVGPCHKGHAIAHGLELPRPADRDVRTGRRAAKALSRQVERGLPTTTPQACSNGRLL
eukprot:350290-Chlamydomonas_euryale.AAC.4